MALMTTEQHLAVLQSMLDVTDRNAPRSRDFRDWTAYTFARERHDAEIGRLCEIMAAVRKGGK